MPDSEVPPSREPPFPHVAPPARDADLARRLDILREAAEELLHTPLRALPENQRGYIEAAVRSSLITSVGLR